MIKSWLKLARSQNNTIFVFIINKFLLIQIYFKKQYQNKKIRQNAFIIDELRY
jgi:hypothetical protein